MAIESARCPSWMTTAGWMQTLLGMAFGLGALPAGYIADRMGPKKIVMTYLIGAASASIFISTTTSVFAFSLGLVVLGAFISLYHPAGTTLVTMQIRQVGKGLGYHGPTATKRAWFLLYRTSDPRVSTVLAVAETLGVKISDLVKRSSGSRLS